MSAPLLAALQRAHAAVTALLPAAPGDVRYHGSPHHTDDAPTTPGHTPLWTATALSALAGTAASDVDGDALACRAENIATAFERQCIAEHAAAETAERQRLDAQRAAWCAEVERVGRYRYTRTNSVEPIFLTVERIANDRVHFAPHPYFAGGGVTPAVLEDVAGWQIEGRPYEPAPLTDPTPAERAAGALRSLASLLDTMASATELALMSRLEADIAIGWEDAFRLVEPLWVPSDPTSDPMRDIVRQCNRKAAGSAWLRATARALERGEVRGQ